MLLYPKELAPCRSPQWRTWQIATLFERAGALPLTTPEHWHTATHHTGALGAFPHHTGSPALCHTIAKDWRPATHHNRVLAVRHLPLHGGRAVNSKHSPVQPQGVAVHQPNPAQVDSACEQELLQGVAVQQPNPAQVDSACEQELPQGVAIQQPGAAAGCCGTSAKSCTGGQRVQT